MHAKETMLPRRTPTPAEREERRTHARLPPELLKKARSRLSFLSALLVVLCGISMVVEYTIGGHTFELFLVYLTVFAFSAALYAVTKIQRVAHGLALHLGLLYEVAICLVIALGFNWINITAHGEPPLATWVCIWIVVFPLIVPSRPTTTLVAAFFAACTSPLSILILNLMGAAQSTPFDYFLASISPALCIIIAVASSKVVYGMSLDVARARELGSYALTELLGRGGMGEVWRGQHKMLARPAAVKLISTHALTGGDAASAEAMISRFEREAQATATLQSGHTVEVYDFGVTDDGAFYYVMELLDGHDLDDLVKRFGPVPAERAIHILIQACHSLAEAHHKGLIHRDIKPANIFLCRKGLDHDYVKLLDFGLVKTVFQGAEQPEGLTVDGNITGTPAFIAPELALGKKDIDGRTDLYSLGCVAFWLLSGKLVFENETPMETLMDHVKTEPPRLSECTEVEVPQALEDLVHQCLAKDPNARPQSAAELSDRLAAIELESPWTRQRAERWWNVHLPMQGNG